MYSNFIHPSAHVDPAARLVANNTVIGANCQIGPEVSAGVNVVIGPDTRIYGKVSLGNVVHIGQNVTLVGPLIIENDVTIANGVSIGVEIAAESALDTGKIGRGAVIGSQARVLGRLSLGEFSQVLTGAHLLGDLPHHAVARGDPAFLETFACECRCEYRIQRQPSGLVRCTCPDCGSEYRFGPVELEKRGKILLPGDRTGQPIPPSISTFAPAA
jgi:UDP-2-acetamido-3-amino-2,3-dideoxy-glucuronate N-acetyltransferase